MGREEGLKTCAKVSLDPEEREGANSTVTCSLSTVTCPESKVTGFRVPSGPPSWTVMTAVTSWPLGPCLSVPTVQSNAPPGRGSRNTHPYVHAQYDTC